jgi:intracellular septation protein A
MMAHENYPHEPLDPQEPLDPLGSPRRVDAGTLWAGGLATALVAALIALTGVVVFRGVFGVPIMAPEEDGTWGNATTTWLMVAAAAAALIATALAHLLLLSTPRAMTLFGWIIALATVVVGVAPFATGADLASQFASALINVVVGLAILGLVSGVARTAVARAARGT